VAVVVVAVVVVAVVVVAVVVVAVVVVAVVIGMEIKAPGMDIDMGTEIEIVLVIV
jgi:hypothetical protein